MSLAWLLRNWKLAGAAGGVLLAFAYGYHLGMSRANRAWESSLERSRAEAQASADRHAEEYEKRRARDDAARKDIERRLADEKERNAAYAACRAGPGFLRLYRDAAGGQPAGQPGGRVPGAGAAGG